MKQCILVYLVCFTLSVAANPTTCNTCFSDAGSGDDVAKCNKEQKVQPCASSVFPVIGKTHCFTAAGRYKYLDGSQVILTGVSRGCINCADKKKACEDYLVAFNGLQNWILLDCNIECCTEDNCNDQYVAVISSTPTPTRTTTPTFGQGVQGSVDPGGNGNPIPTHWIIIIVLVGVLLIASPVLFVWCRRWKARRDAERSRTAEEAAQYNYILDEIKNNSSLPHAKTALPEIMDVNENKRPATLPPLPRYENAGPGTIEPGNHERRDSGMYEELNFGTVNDGHAYENPVEEMNFATVNSCQDYDDTVKELNFGTVNDGHAYENPVEELNFATVNDGQDYENPDEFKADHDEYLTPLNDTSLPTENPSSNVGVNHDGDNSDVNEYVEPMNDASLPNGNPSSNVGAKPDEEKPDLAEYVKPLNDASLPTEIPSYNVDDNPDDDKSKLGEYLEPLNDTNLSDGNPASIAGANPDETDLGEYVEPLSDTSLPTGNPASNVSSDSEYLELVSDKVIPVC